MCTAEAAHNFLAKNIMPTDFQSFIRFNQSLTNAFVKLMMLWTTRPCITTP